MSIDEAVIAIQLKLDRVLQKQDYNTNCLHTNITTLSDNDQNLARSIDRLTIQTGKKMDEMTTSHGKELVVVNNSLEVLKKQVYTVHTNVE